ncbi:hypothetical protein AVEN_58231-1 [Araneus ventricosus]|uniref:Uncharacterized protein n=1 Tax=Araneus ventricosus TaxID=182803 RepID=A0A4Y2JQA4_ARAVE|nr:hypothetical protein AVEN_58231-1 [Araneus ventricosus]
MDYTFIRQDPEDCSFQAVPVLFRILSGKSSPLPRTFLNHIMLFAVHGTTSECHALRRSLRLEIVPSDWTGAPSTRFLGEEVSFIIISLQWFSVSLKYKYQSILTSRIPNDE